jgi:hypothetical protein
MSFPRPLLLPAPGAQSGILDLSHSPEEGTPQREINGQPLAKIPQKSRRGLRKTYFCDKDCGFSAYTEWGLKLHRCRLNRRREGKPRVGDTVDEGDTL